MVAAICLVGLNAIFKWLLFSSCSTKLERAGEFQTETERFLPRSSVSQAGHDRVEWCSRDHPTSIPCGWGPSGGCGGRSELRPAGVGARDRRALVSSSCRLLRESRPRVAGELCGLSERVTQRLVLTALLGEAVNTSHPAVSGYEVFHQREHIYE